MPGLVGIASTRGPEAAARRFALASARLARHGSTTQEVVTSADGTCRIGHVRLAFGPSISSEPRQVDRPTAMFHGVLYNEAELRRRVSSPASVTALLEALYTQAGASFVAELEGEFSLALFDPAAKQVLIATDPVGNYPVYWRADADGLVFASDLSAVVKATPAAGRLNLRAVADYLTIGFVLQDRTLAEGIALLDPGTVLIYDLAANRTTQDVYFSAQALFEGARPNRAEYFDAVVAAFKQSVTRAKVAAGPVGLSLSGGLDSRALLGAIGDASAFKTYTLGIEGCADQVIASQLSRIAGTRHQFFPLSDAYLGDFLPNMSEMASITDGMYLSHGLTEMLALEFLRELGIQVLLRGHGGELAKAHLAWPLHTDAHIRNLQTIGELVPYLSDRANYITREVPLTALLTQEAAALAGPGSRASLAEVLNGTSLGPAQACSFLYLRELTRRFTVPSLELFRTVVDVRMPYLDPRYLHVLLAAPPEWRDSTEIHRRLTASGDGRLLKVRNSNTGAPADAGAKREFVLDKLNTILKRLNVHGYRHYHNFDAWMRTVLLETVERELLLPTARVRSFVAEGAVRKLIAETRQGTADRSHLLQVLLILELWQRENLMEAA